MNKKTAVIIICAIIFVAGIFFIDARFGVFKNNGLRENTSADIGRPVIDLKARSIVLETYTGIIPTQKCGEVGLSIFFKTSNKVSLNQDSGSCKTDKKRTLLSEGTYQKNKDSITVKTDEQTYVFKQVNDTLQLVEIKSWYKPQDDVYTFQKTRIVNYISDDNKKTANVEYASFGKRKIAKISLSTGDRFLLSQDNDSEYKGLSAHWMIKEKNVVLTTATTTIYFKQEE